MQARGMFNFPGSPNQAQNPGEIEMEQYLKGDLRKGKGGSKGKSQEGRDTLKSPATMANEQQKMSQAI